MYGCVDDDDDMYDGDDDDDMYGRVDDDDDDGDNMYGDGDNSDMFIIILMRLATMMISFHNHTYYIYCRIMERTK